MSEVSPAIEAVCRRFEIVKRERSTWESHWSEIAERVLPRQSKQFFSNTAAKGSKRTEKLFDPTAALALEKFAAIFSSMLTPTGQRWHRLRASDPALNQLREVQLWFESVTDVLFDMRYAAKANYESQQNEIYVSLGAFGSGSMFVDWHDDVGLRYRAIHIGEIYFLENHQGIIDTVFREFKLTARQIKQRWGENNLPSDVLTALSGNKNVDQEFVILHLVRPNAERVPGRLDALGMRFESLYIALGEKHELSRGGFATFPYPVSRYLTAPGETYGRSPAMMVLPGIKTLNEQKKTMLKQGHRAVDPILLAHDDGVLDSFSLRPGAINYGGVNAQGKLLVQTLPVGTPVVGAEMMADERAAINDAFLVNLFQILIDSPQMTATEVLERTREKAALLSPTLGRQQAEMLGPMIERELDLLSMQGLLPDMPGALVDAGGEFRVEYDNPISQAQKAQNSAGFQRTVESVLNFVQQTGDASPLDWFDMDRAVPEMAETNAVLPSWIRSPDAVQDIRDGRAEAAAEQQGLDAAPALAGLAKAAQ